MANEKTIRIVTRGQNGELRSRDYDQQETGFEDAHADWHRRLQHGSQPAGHARFSRIGRPDA